MLLAWPALARRVVALGLDPERRHTGDASSTCLLNMLGSGGRITDRGHPAFVMLNIEEYRRLQGKASSLFSAGPKSPVLSLPGGAESYKIRANPGKHGRLFAPNFGH
jgi:hypothetical protein